MKITLFLGSIICLALGIYFAINNNLFLSIIAIVTSSFFSSTRKYYELRSRIKRLEKRMY